MKNNIKKTVIFFVITSILLLTGCFNPVFYEIRQDVPPEKATISGNIIALTRYNVSGEEYIVVAANEGIRYKLASEESHVKWGVVENLPFTLHYYDYYHRNPNGTTGAHIGQQIIKTAADENNLYMLTVEYENSSNLGTVIPKQFYLYSAAVTDWDNVTWTEIGSEYVRANTDGSTDKSLFQFYESNDYYHTRFNLFSTNEVKKNHRFVYIRSGSKEGQEYYSVSNGVISKIADPVAVDDSTDEKKTPVNSAAYFGGKTIFFTGSAVCSNENGSDDATIVYYGKKGDTNLYYWNNEGEHKGLSVSYAPSCIAVTKDSLLIGRGDYETESYSRGGIVKTSLDDDGIPGKSLVSFTTNASSQLTSSYFILTLLSVDPTRTETEAILYSSISFRGSGSSTSVSYNNVGLWSYYKNRKNWNRE